MTTFVDVGSSLINVDEILSVVDDWCVVLCTKHNYTMITYKNGTQTKHTDFKKADLLKAINNAKDK